MAKVINPLKRFYELYNQDQIQDIIENLERHHEVPRQYNYFDEGADRWDEHAELLAESDISNALNNLDVLLLKNTSYIDYLTTGCSNVNVIDVGAGNALPVKEFLGELTDRGVLKRYIAVDISSKMLAIAKRNIDKWFGDSVAFEGCLLDVSKERLDKAIDLGKSDNTINLILFLGGTPYNFRDPDEVYKVIHDSMNPNDFLIHTQKLDSPESRGHFDFKIGEGKSKLPLTHRLMFDLLNIDHSLYDVELGYDAKLRQRYERIKLKIDVALEFDLEQTKRVVKFDKGESILVWRYWQQTAFDVAQQFDRNGFYILHSSQTKDQEYILTVSRAKAE